MKTVQCTFRLPDEVVDLIDKQIGKTRTDKLLSLLGFSCNQTDYTVIENRLSDLERRLSQLELKDSGVVPPKKKIDANEKRAKEVKERLFKELDALKEKNEIPFYRGKPSITKISEITGIDRGTISKYIKDWGSF